MSCDIRKATVWPWKRSGRVLDSRLRGRGLEPHWRHCVVVLSALDKLLGQLGIYATCLSSIAYLKKQLRIFFF